MMGGRIELWRPVGLRKSAGSVDASKVSNEATTRIRGRAKMCVFYIEMLGWAADN